ncbi:hypothetical protein [Achromobacter aloeverae]
MINVKNTAAFVVNIGGALSIPPLARADVDENSRGVARLIERGVLQPTAPAPAGKKGFSVPTSNADAGSQAGGGAPPSGGVVSEYPTTVAALREALKDLNVPIPAGAAKADMAALYDEAIQKKAAGGNPDQDAGAGAAGGGEDPEKAGAAGGQGGE